MTSTHHYLSVVSRAAAPDSQSNHTAVINFQSMQSHFIANPISLHRIISAVLLSSSARLKLSHQPMLTISEGKTLCMRPCSNADLYIFQQWAERQRCLCSVTSSSVCHAWIFMWKIQPHLFEIMFTNLQSKALSHVELGACQATLSCVFTSGAFPERT